MLENTILRKNREGKKALVLALASPSTEAVELAALAGFDAIHLDGEHGAFSPESLDLLCRLANGHGLSVTARVPDTSASTIASYLDRGVQGIQGPHIETGAEAQALADACLFPPDGWRSWGAGRGALFNDASSIEARFGSRRAFAAWVNRNMVVTAQIESRPGWENLDEILRVAGVTEIAGGLFDFAASLGLPGEPDHPQVQAAFADIVRRTRSAGKSVAGDRAVRLSLQEALLSAGRRFVAEHGQAAFRTVSPR